MFEMCRRAYLAPDLNARHFGWNTYIPDSREGEESRTAEQLDIEESSWFQVQSSHLYTHPSVVLVEEVVLRDDVAKPIPDESQKVGDLHRRRTVKDVKTEKQTKAASSKHPYISFDKKNSDRTDSVTDKDIANTSQAPHHHLQRKETGKSILKQTVKDSQKHGSGEQDSGQNRTVRDKPATGKEGLLTDRNTVHAATKKGKDKNSSDKRSLIKDQQARHVTQDDVCRSFTVKKQTSGENKSKQTSFAQQSGVLRRMELDAESFFEFLFSSRWNEGCLVRVLSGKLLDNLLHSLTKLEKFHDVISFATVAYMYHKRPVVPCLKTAQEKTQYELKEERVLVELDCFSPQERPEAMKQQLETMGCLCPTEDPSDADEAEEQSETTVTVNPVSQDTNPKDEQCLAYRRAEIEGEKQSDAYQSSKPISSHEDEHVGRNMLQQPSNIKPLSNQDSCFCGTQKLGGTPDYCETSISAPFVPASERPATISSRSKKALSFPILSVSASQSGEGNHTSKSSTAVFPLIKGAAPSTHTSVSNSDAVTAKTPRHDETQDQCEFTSSSSAVAFQNSFAMSGAETASSTPKHSVSAPNDADRMSKSSIPDLPPIKDAVPSSHISAGTTDSSHQQPDSMQDSPHDSMVPGSSEDQNDPWRSSSKHKAESGGTVQQPDLRCNIRGLVQPRPHKTCLRPYHMIREPFFQRRDRQQSAFPRIRLPELPLTMTLDQGLKTDQEWFWDLEEEKYLGKILEDDTELVASTTSLQEIPTPSVSEVESVSCVSRKQLVSKFAKELALENRQKTKKAKRALDGDNLSLDSFDLLEQEDEPRDPVREETLRRDLELMRKELLVSQSVSKPEKTNMYQRCKAALKDKRLSRQLNYSKECKPTGEAARKLPVCTPFSQPRTEGKPTREVAGKLPIYPPFSGPGTEGKPTGVAARTLPVSSPVSHPVPTPETSVHSLDSFSVSSLSYQHAPTPDPPFNFLRKWHKTPDFYEFYLYLLEGTLSGKTSVEGRPSLECRLSQIQESSMTMGNEAEDSDAWMVGRGHGRYSRSRSRRKQGTYKGQPTEHDEGKKKKHRESRQESDDAPKRSKKKICKEEAMAQLHAHTRIQIAAQERQLEAEGLRQKVGFSLPHTKLSSEELLKRARIGITPSGSHILTEEQEMLLEGEEFILSSIDPWHISVLFAYLAGGVCDSVRVRNDLLQRRERIMRLIEESKQIVKRNEMRVKAMMEVGQPKASKQAQKEEETDAEAQVKTKADGKSSSAKEKTKKSGRQKLSTRDDHEGDKEQKKKHGKDHGKAPESGKEMDEEERHKRRKSRGADSEEEGGKKHSRAQKDSLTSDKTDKQPTQPDTGKTAGKQKGKGKKRMGTRRKDGRKRDKERAQPKGGYVYIDDSKIPDNVSPDKLFRLMRLDTVFNPTKLHSAYSFEKIFSHKKDKIPNYSKLLKKFGKPFKRRKKSPNTRIKRKAKETEEEVGPIEEPESPVEPEASPEVPFVLGKMRDFKFLKYRNHKPEPIHTEDRGRGEMSMDQICQNMILAMQMFVVRKERATMTFGTCQCRSKVTLTFTKRQPGDACLGVPPFVDGRRMVAAVCQTLKTV